MTKEEKCRLIAVGLLGWRETGNPKYGATPPDFEHTQLYPDFFTDEAANALVLDRIIESDRRYGCPYVSHPLMTRIVSMKEDRKTAIAECALRLIDTPHVSGHTS